MAEKPTIADVARRAGVTKATVSHVYSGKRKISEETQQRVFKVARELKWEPSASARAFANRRTDVIGIVLARDAKILATDVFFPAFLAGVQESLSLHEMSLILQVASGEESEARAYQKMANGRVDGVILLDLELHDKRLDLVDELQLPTVIVGDYGASSNLTQVYIDDQAAMREIVDHLLALGHTRITHVSGPKRYIHAHARREAFLESMRMAGLDDYRHLVVETDFTAERGRAVTRELLDTPDAPTAICYANDQMAIAGLSYAQQKGLRIPEDLSITGFDDSELAANMGPGVTTIASCPFEIGKRASEALIETINDRPTGRIELDCHQLLIRGSTGRCRLEV